MNRRSVNEAVVVWWIMGAVLCIWVLLFFVSPVNAQRSWYSSLTSEDGTTVVKMTQLDKWGDVVDLGFFGAADQMRTEIAARHKPYSNPALSSDGYLLLFGEVTGKAARFLSLYDPHGGLRWELELEAGCQVAGLDIAARGYRTAAWVYPAILLLLDEKGSTLQMLPLKSVSWLKFCCDDRFLVATTASEVLLFESKNYQLLQRVPRTDGATSGNLIAVSDDGSYIALLDRVEVQEQQKAVSLWRVTVLFATGRGAVLEQETLPVRYRRPKEKALRHDSKKGIFAVETEEGTYEVAFPRIPWLGAYPSDDGSSVIKMTGPLHAPGELVDIGFFDAAGNKRALVRARHRVMSSFMSCDGCLLVVGWLAGKAGQFLTLYDAYGSLMWEIEMEAGHRAGPLDVARQGYRTAVWLGEYRVQPKPPKYLLLIDEKGSAVQKLPQEYIGGLRFLGDGRFLAVAAKSEVILFESERLGLVWRAPLDVGVTHGNLLKMSDDGLYVALLDRVRAQEDERIELLWRATIFDARTGEILNQQTLPSRYEHVKEKPLRYDAEQRVFVVETEEGSYKVTVVK